MGLCKRNKGITRETNEPGITYVKQQKEDE
jgi:hypothetical protein